MSKNIIETMTGINEVPLLQIIN